MTEKKKGRTPMPETKLLSPERVKEITERVEKNIGHEVEHRNEIKALLAERELLVGIVRKLERALQEQAGATAYGHASAEIGTGKEFGWNPECREMQEVMADPNLVELLKEQG